jgi:hypothetical protein
MALRLEFGRQAAVKRDRQAAGQQAFERIASQFRHCIAQKTYPVYLMIWPALSKRKPLIPAQDRRDVSLAVAGIANPSSPR